MQKTRAQHASNQDATAGLGGIRRLSGKGVAWVEIVLIFKSTLGASPHRPGSLPGWKATAQGIESGKTWMLISCWSMRH